MQQVLFYIPVQASWLPAFLPLPLVVFLFFLLLAGVMWFIAPREPFRIVAANWQALAKWLAGIGAAAAAGMYFVSQWWPDGIPVNGFGMMLFVAFLLCNWVAGRLAVGTTFLTIARGPSAARTIWPRRIRRRNATAALRT